MKLISWNVNGIRAIYKKGFVDWIETESPDILCIQETKAWKEQLGPELLEINGYVCYFSEAEKKGYSGVAVYTKIQPENVATGFGIPEFDSEGRILKCEYKDFILFNIYFPNGKASKQRLDYKMRFYDAFLEHVEELKKAGNNIIICGDVNTAHAEIDLARPKENSERSGFLPEERAWIDKFLAAGYVDTFREFNKDPENYTWWDYKTRARSRNVGWRIDYFFCNTEFQKNLDNAYILSDVMGSDHCPIAITLK